MKNHLYYRLLTPSPGSIAVFVVVNFFLFLGAHLAHGQQPISEEPAKKKCTCLFTDSCKKNEICQRTDCEGSTDPFNPLLGVCQAIMPPVPGASSAQGLNAILLAYETAGTQGGPVNPGLIAELKRLGLDEAHQATLHDAALALMSTYIGSDDPQVAFRKGYLIAPRPTDKCYAICLRSVAPFQAYLKRDAPSIREAIIADLSDPSLHSLERTLRRISKRTPGFLTFGQCEYPFPLLDAKVRYGDRIECVVTEIGNILAALRQPA